MLKSRLYQHGLLIADIDQDNVKGDAQCALSDGIVRERLLLDKTDNDEAFTFRFVDMRRYTDGYTGSCYWVSFHAHRPYIKKDGHYPNKTPFDLWIYWDHDHWQVLPFKQSTLHDDIRILMQSWQIEEELDLTPRLKELAENQATTTDDIYVDVLQRLQNAHAHLGASITYEDDEHIEVDEEGNEIYSPAGEAEAWFMITDEIKLDEENTIVLPHSAFDIDDLAKVVFDVEEYHPSPLDPSLSFEERIEQTTDLETLCSLINELADMGCEVTMKGENKDGAPRVQVLDVEYINNKEGFDGWTRLLSRGKYRIHYIPLPKDGVEERLLDPDEVKTTELPTYMSFLVWYNPDAVCSRIDHGDEDALTYYHTSFLPKIRAARANEEIPSLLF